MQDQGWLASTINRLMAGFGQPLLYELSVVEGTRCSGYFQMQSM